MIERPEPLVALVARLEQAGFAADERPPDRDSFGDQVSTFTAEDLRVRVTRDRGQWAIELGHPAWEDLYDPDIWRAALEGTDPTDPSPLAEQAAFVADKLGALRAAARDPALHERLDEIAVARADLWFR